MDLTGIFWIFLIVSMLQPVLRQKMLESCRGRLLRQIEQKRSSRVILLIHRQETMSFLGFPVFRYIDINDSEQVIRALRLTAPEVPIDLVLHTPGGLVLASMQIARAIKDRKGKVTVHIPHYAMSGGTLIALAADEIVMDPHAALGPVDPQIGEYPAASLVRAVASKEVDKLEDKTLIMADVAEKALAQVRGIVLELLLEQLPPNRAAEVADKLSQGTWTHDHPLTLKELQALGLNATSDMPLEIYKLMNLYSQPTRREPSVQYIPTPYGPPPVKE
jgi:ClpP class serine protease